MISKILVLVSVALCQVTLAQQPTAFPGLGSSPFLGGFNGNWVRPYYTAAAEGWRTYFEQIQSARNQLYQTLTSLQGSTQNAFKAARGTLTQILSAIPVHTKQGNLDDNTELQILGGLQPPAVEVPVHHDVHETQVVTTVTRPQVQSDVPHVRPQGQIEVQHSRPQGHVEVSHVRPQEQTTVTHVAQSQPASRQPQGVNLQSVATNNRPLTSNVPQVTPQGAQMAQIASQIASQLGSQLVPQGGSQMPWVGK